MSTVTESIPSDNDEILPEWAMFFLVGALGAVVASALIGGALACYYCFCQKEKDGQWSPTAAGRYNDNKLAFSAHKFHYEKRKEEILAKERRQMDVDQPPSESPSAVSQYDFDSEDVVQYPAAIPADATDLEIKNPLFQKRKHRRHQQDSSRSSETSSGEPDPQGAHSLKTDQALSNKDRKVSSSSDAE